MNNFPDEETMQKEFMPQIEAFFPDYKICNEQFPVPILVNGKQINGDKKIDILLKHKTENKLLVVELKNEKENKKDKQCEVEAKPGILCQIYLYFVGLKQKKEFENSEISIVVIFGDTPKKSHIGKLELAMLARGKKIECINEKELEFKNELELKTKIEEKYQPECIEKGKGGFLLKRGNGKELLVVACKPPDAQDPQTSGYRAFGQISLLIGEQIKKDELERKYEKISGVVIIADNREHEEELKFAIKENETTMANINVKFMTWHKDKKELELNLESNK